jgi:hypothetical protein
MAKYWVILLLGIGSFMAACTKQTETLNLSDIKEFYPLSVGNVFTYRMDSTRLTNFTKFTTAYYLVKDTVTGTFLDNQGRTCYSVSRLQTDTLMSQPYQYNYTYYVVYDKNKIEYVDGSNLRFIKLTNPVSFNTVWLGNIYLDAIQDSITSNTSYTGWNYQYTSITAPYSVSDSLYQNTLTVQQASDSSAGVFDETKVNRKTYSIEVYAQGAGLVYKEFTNYFFQPPMSNPYQAGHYEDGSFSIKLRLIKYKK